MTVSELVAAAYLRATGTVSTLTNADDEWDKILQLANIYQQEWANEPGVDWYSLYSPAVSCGTVTTTDTFSLGATIHKISQNEDDFIKIVHTPDTTQYTYYTLISPDRLKVYNTGEYVARVGSSLKFNKTFETTDAQFGGTIYVPAFTLPSALSGDSDTVTVDDPYWLATRVAAEYARTDYIRQNQYPNLLAEANELMKKMIENNRPQQNKVVMRSAATGRTF